MLYNNELIDNFSVGILFLIKNNKVYLSYGKFLFNNIGIKIIESADVVFLNTKNSDILLQHNNIGVYLSQSININILVFKMIMYDNLINIYLNRLSANINLNNLQVFKGKGILSYCFGEIYINNSCFFDLDYVLELYNYTQIYLDSIKVNNSIITFCLNNICSLSLENSTLDKSYLILFSLGKTYFYNNNNKFLNSNYGFILQEQTVLNMLTSTVDNVEIVFSAVIYSSAYIYNNNIKKSRIVSFITGNSSLFFNKNLIESFTHSFVVRNRGKLLINDCSCKNKQNIFIDAKHYSEISQNECCFGFLYRFTHKGNL